jgi:uncharacterized protein YecE (DUF72 family)
LHKPKREAGLSHLAYYAEHFSCVEINSSFYRPHRKSTYHGWKVTTPPAFRFAVKMPRTITHECALRHAASEVNGFFSGVEALQPKLGAVLIQLPPSLEFSAALVRAFFKSVPRCRGVRLVCEPRHASWFTESADALLEQLDVSRAATDPAPFPAGERPGGCRSFNYFRWHGSPRMYYSSYSKSQLESFAGLVKAARDADAWCIFDNTARYAAWDNAASFIAQYPLRRSNAGCPPIFARRRTSVRAESNQ